MGRVLALVIAALLAAPAAAFAQPQVIPQPYAVTAAADPAPTAFAQGAPIHVPAGDAGALQAAERLRDLVQRTRGLSLTIAVGDPGPGVVIARQPGLSAEAYSLDVEHGQARIAATGDAGLFYGAETLWQLMTEDGGRGPVSLAAVRIDDHPQYAWRGLLLDSARHFQGPAFVKGFIDRMAQAKLNVLHWHLVDDQGWRLEIKKYPRFTEVGAWRVPAGAAAQADIDPRTHAPRKEGGFYTQSEVREIVAYAAARHVTIVPEIEMPGHAQAAIAAYPALGSAAPGQAPSGPSSDWGVFTQLYNVDDATFGVLEDVLDEVMALFPGRYIHVGGDEAVKTQWKASPSVQARMKALWIGDEDVLQGWFIGRIEQYLNAHGRKLVGWDEILQGGVAPGATVMSWRGLDGAIIAAKLGHDTVLAAQPTYYLDNWQGAGPDEPPGRGHLVSLKEVYDFDPMPAVLTPAERTHVLGVQAQLWSEHIRTEERMAWMAFPRALAVAETGWTPKAGKDWTSFTSRLATEEVRERALGQAFATTPLQAPPPPSGPTRTSQQMKLCSGAIVLNLEDDAPVRGERARFLVDIMHPCWIYESAELTGVTALQAAVGQLPFNFQIGEALKYITFHPPVTPEGELEVRQDTCNGPVVAVLPLAPATRSQAVTVLKGPIKADPGRHDLCFTFTQKTVEPLWVLDRVTLGAPGGR